MSNATGEISYGGITGLPYKKISRTRKSFEFYTWIRVPVCKHKKALTDYCLYCGRIHST